MSTARRDLQTRDEYLRKVGNDREPHASITRADERVRVYGDTAVVTQVLTRTTQGKSFVFRVTDVCVLRDGRWQLVNRHITEVPQASAGSSAQSMAPLAELNRRGPEGSNPVRGDQGIPEGESREALSPVSGSAFLPL